MRVASADVDSSAAFRRCFTVKGNVKLMTQPLQPIAIARITRPTIAKATVTGIRVENELLRGWVSWAMSSHIHCYGCAS